MNDAEVGQSITDYSGQAPYALGIQETTDELNRQTEAFMSISDQLKQK